VVKKIDRQTENWLAETLTGTLYAYGIVVYRASGQCQYIY